MCTIAARCGAGTPRYSRTASGMALRRVPSGVSMRHTLHGNSQAPFGPPQFYEFGATYAPSPHVGNSMRGGGGGGNSVRGTRTALDPLH